MQVEELLKWMARNSARLTVEPCNDANSIELYLHSENPLFVKRYLSNDKIENLDVPIMEMTLQEMISEIEDAQSGYN